MARPKGVKNGQYRSPQSYGDMVMYNQYKNNARRKGLPFELTQQQVFILISNPCYYCGLEPQKRYSFTHYSNMQKQLGLKEHLRGQFYLANGIDRVNNKLGYTLDNCCACCSECNASKSNMSVDAWLNMVERIYKHQNRQ